MQIYYINSAGNRVDFGSFPVVLQEPEKLLSNQWKYTSVENQRKKNIINRFYKGIAEKGISISIFADSADEFEDIMLNLHNVTEYDVINNTPGRLYVNGYYLECFFISKDYSEYEEAFYAIEISATIVAPNPLWIMEYEYVFRGADATDNVGKKYPHRYAYRYPNGLKDTTVQNHYITDCNFSLYVFGPILNPQIIIGKYTYLVNVLLETGEYMIINSRDKTVKKIMNNGTVVNIFDYRDKKNSVFRKISPGKNQIRWSGKFDFTLKLYEERSEPKWR